MQCSRLQYAEGWHALISDERLTQFKLEARYETNDQALCTEKTLCKCQNQMTQDLGSHAAHKIVCPMQKCTNRQRCNSCSMAKCITFYDNCSRSGCLARYFCILDSRILAHHNHLNIVLNLKFPRQQKIWIAVFLLMSPCRLVSS